MNVIEQAFSHGNRPDNWDKLSRWLRAHASHVNRVSRLIGASQLAQEDGRPFPNSADETRWVLEKYRWQAGRH